MSSINPINVNSQGVGGSYGFNAQAKTAKDDTKQEQAQVQNNEQSTVSADKVLDYLSASSSTMAASVTGKNNIASIDTSKYVDDASKARIAAFVQGFEDKVAEGLQAFDKEFSGASVSDSTKMAVVLKQLDQEA